VQKIRAMKMSLPDWSNNNTRTRQHHTKQVYCQQKEHRNSFIPHHHFTSLKFDIREVTEALAKIRTRHSGKLYKWRAGAA
jgi:hypothetical protein